MISNENQPNQIMTSDEDFTEVNYRKLLRAANASYTFVTYEAIPWDSRFILWRHDLDYSINRALSLACIEAEENVTATYFVNPHSEYYNPFEPEQANLLKHILSLGHRLGLHFDATFFNIQNEEQLHSRVAQEGSWLEEVFGVRPDAFSFHNPGVENLQCDANHYGGLVNCYSKRFKTEVSYCSDSNGYWRFRRLHDVLSEGTDPCLQVLTHPGWWQRKPMPPRQRIFRAILGRAQATVSRYDAGLDKHGRINHAGLTDRLRFLQPLDHYAFILCDYLWNQGHLELLLVELWRLHERQINQLCKVKFLKEWKVPPDEVNTFFQNQSLVIDSWLLFSTVFGSTWQRGADLDDGQYRDWIALRNDLIHGRSSAAAWQLERGCIFICRAIETLVSWGNSQSMAYNGISHLASIGVPMHTAADGSMTDRLEEIAVNHLNFPNESWVRFKARMISISEVSE